MMCLMKFLVTTDRIRLIIGIFIIQCDLRIQFGLGSLDMRLLYLLVSVIRVSVNFYFRMRRFFCEL